MAGLTKKTFILGFTALVAYIIFNQLLGGLDKYYPGFDLSKESRPYATPLATPSASKAVATPSSQTSVDPKKLAEKVDFSRKLINTDTKNISKLESEIKKNGGKVVSKVGGVLVADLPDEKTNEIAESLQKSGLTKNLETDYPSFLTAESIDWGVQKLEAESVWPINKGEGVKVAVIDTGVDYNHSDLKDNYAGGYDFVNKDSDPIDDHGHGTHVSGTIASAMNQSGLVGITPLAKIVAIKVLSGDGIGYISDLIAGINYAVTSGAQVINLSLGTTYDSSLLKQAVDEAASKGVIVVAAAGNNNGGPLLYPAAYSSVISVAATDINNQLASFSAVGAELSAPGVAITSTTTGNGYAAWSGTSMAAPHVSAAAAMLVSAKVANVRERLRETSTDLGTTGRDSSFGYGLVNLKTAFNNPDTTAPLVTILSPENNDSVKGTVTIKVAAKDENGVTTVELWLDNNKLVAWSAPPYDYRWDYSDLSGERVLMAKATDPSGNEGSAKVTIDIQRKTSSPTPPPSPGLSPSLTEPSPISSPSPSSSPDESATPSAQPREREATSTPDYGRSFEVRKDLENEKAQQHRKNFEKLEELNKERSSTKSSEKEEERERLEKLIRDYAPYYMVPDVTNFGKRNKKFEEDKKVKGLKTYR